MHFVLWIAVLIAFVVVFWLGKVYGARAAQAVLDEKISIINSLKAELQKWEHAATSYQLKI